MSEKSKAAFNSGSGSVPGPYAANVPPPSFDESVQDGSSTFKTRFACIAFALPDRMRLIQFPEVEMAAVYEVVKASWPLGIGHFRPHDRSREIKLNGYPWGADKNGNDDGRRLVLCILESLYNMGWVLETAVDVTMKKSSRDSLVFRRQNPVPPPCEWISISFNCGDKLKVLGAQPKELVDAILHVFSAGIERHEATSDRLKVKFKGYPWCPSEVDAVKTGVLLLALLDTLEHCGFTLYATTSVRFDSESESDVLVCQRQRDWIPGAPIWHR
ncbi:hypothetical protein EDB81DRAFT_683289 [Dactylonectria macrodidyma]|uniref:Uncharacterized protein n=1 Tax=Dactylonectria macrodidyma TaxID=307937 RepID=A0A9P9FGR5_9HYPO|nr:hypothetical protein EDB81DRAFT_683289 [Dactylonectria macrodidyma]